MKTSATPANQEKKPNIMKSKRMLSGFISENLIGSSLMVYHTALTVRKTQISGPLRYYSLLNNGKGKLLDLQLQSPHKKVCPQTVI